MAQDLERVSLKTAIAGLRRQIKEAAEEAQGLHPDEFRFRITSVELELTVVAEDSATTGGEVGWWILKGKADIGMKDTITHKVKLSLNVGDLQVGAHETTA